MSFALALLVSFATGSKAAVYQYMENDSTLLTYFPGYEVYKYYDFIAWTVNDEAIGDWAYGSETVFTVASVFSMVACESEGLTNFYFANVDNGYGDLVVSYRSGYGFYDYGSGYRPMYIGDMQAGQIVILEEYQGQSYTAADSLYDYSNCENITDSIHALQEAIDSDGDGEADGTNDGFFYFRMTDSGYFSFMLSRGCYVPSLAILQSEDAEEFVTAPSMKVSKVNGSAREITVTDGYSSLGYDVTTWYSIDGSDPLFLVDTDEIASADTIWAEDSLSYELDNITYVQVPQADDDGNYGDFLYEGDAISFDSNDDEDADGYILLKMATVSETGVYSSTVELSISIGEITLNEPTLTLYTLDGTSRGYTLGWTNNTLCDEDYSFQVEYDDKADDSYAEGDVIYASDYITVTVSAEGYNDGTYTLDELTDEGVNYYRKNSDADHDWDFVNLSEEMLAKFQGTELDYYYNLDSNGDTVKYDPDDDSVDLPDDVVEVYKDYGWTYDSSKNRSWRNVLVDTLTTTASDGSDSTYTEAYYAEDLTGLFDGLTVTCDPYTNSSSVWSASWAVYTDGSGVYPMSAATVDIEDIVYGEYALATCLDGSVITKAEDAEEGLTITIPKQSYWYYLDIYTTDDLGVYDAIKEVNTTDTSKLGNVYSLDGRLVKQHTASTDGLAKGIYILNGKKILVK